MYVFSALDFSTVFTETKQTKKKNLKKNKILYISTYHKYHVFLSK